MKFNIATSLFLSALAVPLGAAAGAAPTAPMRAAPSAIHMTAPTPTTARTPAHATGQPGQSCGSATAPNTPGNAAAAPGSAFNPDGKAGTVYAGQQPQNSRNTASVSQYDLACFHQR